jgi:hypothetical protein
MGQATNRVKRQAKQEVQMSEQLFVKTPVREVGETVQVVDPHHPLYGQEVKILATWGQPGDVRMVEAVTPEGEGKESWGLYWSQVMRIH